jgi:hypothetical protein
MPMSPRLLRPVQRGNFATDPNARAYIDAVRAADGSYMERDVQLAIDAFVVGLKADSLFTAIKACCLLMGPRTLAGALTPLVGAAPTNNGPFVSGDYNRETGLIGDGVGKYLDSNRNHNADPQNSYHQAVYVTTAGTLQDQTYIGVGGGSTGASNIARGQTNNILFWRNQASTGIQQASNAGSLTGIIATSRAASGSYTSLAGSGTATTRSTASQTPFNGNVTVFSDSGTSAFSNARIAYYSIGEAVTLTSLRTRLDTLSAAIAAAI